MTRTDHLLTIFIEECAELQQTATKTLRFGRDDIHPDGGPTNEQRMHHEFNDLYCLFEMLQDAGFELRLSDRLVGAKRLRVEEYLEYSRKVGRLE